MSLSPPLVTRLTTRALTLRRPPSQAHRHFSTSNPLGADFTHAVLGGGVIGLAIAQRLQSAHPGSRTLLLERHASFGTETSSRNSEVIHAGLYYPADSLKTALCVRGKEQLYAFCAARGVGHRRCGKWLVAQDGGQREALEEVAAFAAGIGVPTRWVGEEEAKRREPDVRAQAGVLESSSTGIVDSHGLMQALEGLFAEEDGAMLGYGTEVVGIEAVGGEVPGSKGWMLRLADGEVVTTEVLINSAGNGAIAVNNMVFDAIDPTRRRKAFYAKGSYYSYAASKPKPSVLVYPVPAPGHGGLGTHLTLDMAGRIRFGPDVEWVDSADDLAPNADPARLEAALQEIESYLPGLRREDIAVDYCGIRPKLAPDHAAQRGKGFVDFYIRREEGLEGFVNLLGMESPGLTSSLAIAEEVEKLLYK